MNASRLPSRRVYSSSILPQALFLDSASIQPVRSPSRLHPQWQPLSPDYTSFPLLLSRALAPPFLSYTQFTQNATTPSHRAAKPTPFLTGPLHGPRFCHTSYASCTTHTTNNNNKHTTIRPVGAAGGGPGYLGEQ